MTIYKPKKLKEAEKLKSVSLEVEKRETLLKKDDEVEIHPFIRRKRPLLLGICVLVLLAMAILSLAVGIVIYKRSLVKRNFCGVYDVKYRDISKMPTSGTFKEKVEIDGNHEKLDVPEILDYFSATILHDFENNYTAIVDVLRARCYLLPLNRTLIEPPKNFMDLIEKFKSGYYNPDVEMLRDNYVVDTRTLAKAEEYGPYIQEHCTFYDVYKLHKSSREGMLMKRSSVMCPMEGDKFCLGSTFSSYLPCIRLSQCL